MKKLFLALCATLCFTAGCTAPLMNFNEQPVYGNLSLNDVEQCIVTGGVALGWTMVKQSDGLFEATLQRRGHTAVVNIPYSAKTYSIIYKSSSKGVRADGKGHIHKIYNTWVGNLNRQISTNIARKAY